MRPILLCLPLLFAIMPSLPAGGPLPEACTSHARIRSVEKLEPLHQQVPSTKPVVIAGLTYYRLSVLAPVVEERIVPRRCREVVLQPIYKPVCRPVVCEVLVPVQTRQQRICFTWQTLCVPTLITREVVVPRCHEMIELRPSYQRITRRVPVTCEVYKPCIRLEKTTRLAYTQTPVRITLPRTSYRTVTEEGIDPHTGKKVPTSRIVCETKPVTETHHQTQLCARDVIEKVTDYRLETCTRLRTVEEVVLAMRPERVRHTTYHREQRTCLEMVRKYVLAPRLVEQTLTHYRKELRPGLATDHVLVWEPRAVETTTYHPQTCVRLRPVTVVIPASNEVITTVTRLCPQLVPLTRQLFVIDKVPH